jgi:acetoin utilization deacetylase AcuC-like enzyme
MLRRLVGVRPVPFVYHREYRRWISGVPMDAMRGERILAFLLDEGWVSRRQVHLPRPASVENLQRVHGPDYLRSLDDPGVVARVMGVPLQPEEARVAVELQRLAAGGTIQASRLALAARGPAVHLGGGFHHAGPDRGTGFCLLNDVAVAIARLRARGFDGPVLVVDLDLHDGNGTRAAFAEDPTVHTYSIHNQDWDEPEAVASTSIALGSGVDDATYLDALKGTLPGVVAEHEPEMVFYLAGVDPADGDLYGDGRLSGEGLLARDRFVADTVHAARRRLPFVVTLAGGYGPSAWRHWARFLGWLVAGRTVEPPDDLTAALRRVRWLEGEAPAASGWLDWSLGAEDLGAVAPGSTAEGRLLGRYGRGQVTDGLERFGILDQMRARGYRNPQVEVNPSSGLGPTLRIFGGPDREALLMELRLRVDRQMVPGMRLLFIEWLLLQDPGRPFEGGRDPLPGQEHPGLGVLADVVAWLVTLCRELGMDGMGFRSSHFHMAVLSRRHLRFLRPEDEARFRAIRAQVRGLSLAAAARAVAEGTVSDPETGETLRWIDVPMVVPVSDEMRRRMDAVDGPGSERPGS